MQITNDSLCIPHNLNGGGCNVNHLVKRWNHRARIDITSDSENYTNGDIKFLFEYSSFRNPRLPTLRTIHGRNAPCYVPVILAESTIDNAARKVGNLFDEHLRGKPCVVSGWDKKLVLVDDVELVDEREKFIPSRLRMGLQVEKGLIEGWRDPIGESLLYGFIKPCLGFAVGELDALSFPFSSGPGGGDYPIGMIESGTKIVNNVADDKCGPVNNGFVSFSERGAVSSICICFENIRERATFLEQCAQLVDVFRGPMNLEQCAIDHEKPNVGVVRRAAHAAKRQPAAACP